jgi:hypothetical protein
MFNKFFNNTFIILESIDLYSFVKIEQSNKLPRSFIKIHNVSIEI